MGAQFTIVRWYSQNVKRTDNANHLFNGVNHCGVPVSTPHSFVCARLASESFYFVV